LTVGATCGSLRRRSSSGLLRRSSSGLPLGKGNLSDGR
jgi:hypothetical protein